MSKQLAFELLAVLIALVGAIIAFWPPYLDPSWFPRGIIGSALLYLGARMLQSTFPDEPYDPYE